MINKERATSRKRRLPNVQTFYSNRMAEVAPKLNGRDQRWKKKEGCDKYPTDPLNFIRIELDIYLLTEIF